MKKLVRVGVALSATVGFSALLGAQAVGASPQKSYLADWEALNQTVTSFTVGFTVPHYTCTATNDAVDVYANAYDQTSATSDSFDGGFVELGCNSKKSPVITPALEVDGVYTNPSGFTIRRKDVLDVTVTCGAAGGTATIDDVTQDQSGSVPTPAGSSCNGVFMGNIGLSNRAGTKLLPLPKFGKITFGDADVNGAPIGDASPAPTAVSYYEGAKNVITVGALTDGGSAWVNTQGS
jgi:hypothetical protein